MNRTCKKWMGAMAMGAMLLAAQQSGAWSFGGVVFSDCDKNGIREPGEAGIAGIPILVHECLSGSLVASNVTDASGMFVFTDAQIAIGGTYQIFYMIPSNFKFSPTVWPPPWPFPSATPSQVVSTAVADWGGYSPCFTFDERFILGDFTLNNAGICRDTPLNPGTGTPGFWKNHPEAWPVASITLGGVVYTRDQAIAIMKLATKSDKTLNLAEQLIAAKLNVLIGNDSSCIAEGVALTDTLLGAYPIGCGLKASSPVFVNLGQQLLTSLDQYNNGLLCAPHRD